MQLTLIVVEVAAMFVAVIAVGIVTVVESFDSYSCFVVADQMVKHSTWAVDWDS